MEISGLPINAPQPDVMTQVAVALFDKSLETVEVLGDGMIKMMEQSLQPNLGQNVDVTL